MEKLIIPMKNVGEISDGYHSFDELYDHRIALFVALCTAIYKGFELVGKRKICPVWKSLKHSDNTMFDGWFIMGIHKKAGEQITYHLPEEYWEKTKFAEAISCAPEWD